MMRRIPTPLGPAALLLLLSGCLDFLDPVGLRLAKVTQIEVLMTLESGAEPSGCETVGPAPAAPDTAPPPDAAYLCVRGRVFPGVDKFGAPRPVRDDTLWVLGRPLLPLREPDGMLRYGRRFVLPGDRLADTVVVVTYPVIEGVDVSPRGVRWRAVGRAGMDSVVHAPGEDLVLPLLVPAEPGNPQPPRQSWSVDVAGAASTASVRGGGIPRATYLFPAELLAGLGGERLTADLRWTQDYSPFFASAQTQVRVLLIQTMVWRVVPPDTAGSS